MPKAVQVIDDELEYVRDIEKYIVEEEMEKIGTEFKNIAIIGCQSSGKSTLLNILFDTDFEELNQQDRGMAQTTKGVWVARNSDRNILVFDIEGTDSKERGDDRMTFEQTTSLFALAIADVLLINLWVHDIGRHAASNTTLLQVIFEVNLKLFAQNQRPKKLVFVIRDFNEFQNNADITKKSLKDSIDKIWEGMYKPEKFVDTSVDDFFEFEYCMMPHKIYQIEKFVEAGKELRGRFKLDSSDPIFPEGSNSDVPIDGLPMYIENCWKCIREQKELNLPGEKQMVATYRWGEIKNESIEKIQERLSALQQKSHDDIIADYKFQCKDIVKEAHAHYDESAKQYHKDTYLSVREELTNHIVDLLYKSYVSQIKNLIIDADKKFAKGLRKAFTEDSVSDNFTTLTNDMYDEIIKQFEVSAFQLMMDDSGWETTIKLYVKELSNSMHKLIENERKEQLKKLFEFSLETIWDELEEKIADPIQELEDNLWDKIIADYKKTIEDEEEKVKTILNDGFKTLEEEYDRFIDRLEEKIYSNSKKVIIKTTSDLNSHMSRKFNTYFKKNEKGKNRNWKNMTEEEIQKLHTECYSQFNGVTEQFRKIEIPKHLSSPQMTMGGSFSNVKEHLLSPDDITKIRDKFEQDWEHALEEAIRLHHDIYGGGVPIYFWALFVFFAYDDLFRWLANPILFYPLLFLMTFAGLLQSLGLLMPLVHSGRIMFNLFYNQMRNTGKK